jgi:hypothetical protein
MRTTHIVDPIWRTAKPVKRIFRLHEPPKKVEYANFLPNGTDDDFI